MRISNLHINQQAVDRMLDISRKLAQTQQQIASGIKLQSPGDDPIGAGRVLRLQQDLALREQFTRNVDAAQAQLGLEDAVLSQITDLMQRVRELVIQSGDGAHTRTDNRFIALELRSRLEELEGLMNTRTATGEYLFGGFQGDVRPFEVKGGVTYHGDEGQRLVQIDTGIFVPVSDSGKKIFMDVNAAETTFSVSTHPDNTGVGSVMQGRVVDQSALDALLPDDLVIEFRPMIESTGGEENFTIRRKSDNRVVEDLQNVPYQQGDVITVAGMELIIFGNPHAGDRFIVQTSVKQDLLTTVERMAAALETGDPLEDAIATTLANLDSAAESILATRVEIGTRMNTMDSVAATHEEFEVLAQQTISNLRDVDFTQAVADLSFQSFVLQAAQQSFLRISRLSLFDAL